MTDQGTQFLRHFRVLMKEEDIKLYNTYSEAKASIVEKQKCGVTLPQRKTLRDVDML